ncbi:permease [Pullulanibacillus camelliae]|uniref:Permease n=1 Tax=Pullulanibacillus camelliae TaxID=1707096 RepID=A0A8J2YGA9_9BACL|nr:ABC transporter permease [Pullulanibacillus camelliae]GGE33857.1 permease [Pullulanibacillus camelliae]
MSLFTSIKLAMRNIKGNKLRALLTMLGIIIGVSSVIALVSIGQGSSKSVTDSINSLGTHLLTVNISNTDVPFTMDDVDKINKIDAVKNVSPVLSGRVTLKNGETTTDVALTGSNAAYKSVRNLSVSNGRFITDIDMDYRQKVIVLGSETAQTLFGMENPVGQKLLVNGDSYKVVGVLTEKGGSMGENTDDTVIIPFSTAQRLLGTTHIQQFYAQAKNEASLNIAMMMIERNLYQTFGDSDSYTVANQQDVMDTMSSVNDTMTMLLAGIASISLLVGGIGIMNIMFVSVTERTKEIGIRKSIGARRKDILLQFLIEAVVLSALGGLIGVGIGLIATKIYAVATGSDVVYSVAMMLFAFLFSLVVGIIFGVFPANKASKLNPIQALRFE